MPTLTPTLLPNAAMAKSKWPLWQSLRVRIVAWYSLLVGLTMLTFDGYLYFQFRQSLLDQVDRTLAVAAIQALKNVDDEVADLNFDPRQDASTLASLLDQTGVSVYLFTQDGTLKGRFGDLLPQPTQGDFIPGFQTWRSGAEPWRIYTYPIPAQGNRPAGWLRVAHSLNTVDQTSSYIRRQMFIGGPILLGMVGLGGLFLANRALRPIEQITHMAQQVRESRDLSQRLHYQGVADELERLGTVFDEMLDALQATFAHERRFIADAAHELRTPLTAIKGRLTVTLNRPRNPAEYVETLQALEQEVDRLIRLSNDLLMLSQLEQQHQELIQEAIDLSALLEAISEQVQPLAELKQVSFTTAVSSELQVQGCPDHLIRLFLNLLDNAVKHTPAHGHISLVACRQNNTIYIRVTDTGRGIAANHLPHLFERFYRIEVSRSRQVGGTGLGLAIAQEIAHHHHGSISVDSQLNQGTTFTVTLPRLE